MGGPKFDRQVVMRVVELLHRAWEVEERLMFLVLWDQGVWTGRGYR
jgi:hypothetical protein